VGLLVGTAAGSSAGNEQAGGSTSTPIPTGAQTTPTSTEPSPTTSAPSPSEEPNLDGTWQLTGCDLQLFIGGGDYSTLVGAVKKNTGNVPAEVTVSMHWDALPGPLFDGGTKKVTLQPGGSRELRFTKQHLTFDDVDRAQSSPGYNTSQDSKFCKVKTSIDEA
jgi:hypothetical protein